MVGGASERLTIAAPFITVSGVRVVSSALSATFKSTGRLHVITDLSPAHVSDGSLEPGAILELMAATQNVRLWHVPGLHAKVYMADRCRAIVTSGNLSSGALFRNVEYGVNIVDGKIVAEIDSDLSDVAALGAAVDRDQFAEYVRVAAYVRDTFQRQENRVDPSLREAFRSAVQGVEDELIRFRLAGGAMTAVFAKTIVYVLRRYGPMRTDAIHNLVKTIHPDLCDDTVDRVIDGRHYGKKWKHAVRSAQQQAKRDTLIYIDGGVWHLEGE